MFLTSAGLHAAGIIRIDIVKTDTRRNNLNFNFKKLCALVLARSVKQNYLEVLKDYWQLSCSGLALYCCPDRNGVPNIVCFCRHMKESCGVSSASSHYRNVEIELDTQLCFTFSYRAVKLEYIIAVYKKQSQSEVFRKS